MRFLCRFVTLFSGTFAPPLGHHWTECPFIDEKRARMGPIANDSARPECKLRFLPPDDPAVDLLLHFLEIL